jgi:hypothetical protein
MNRIRLRAAAVLLISLATFVYAQQPGQDSSQPNPDRPTKDRGVAPPPRQPEATPPRGQEETKPPKPQPEATPRKPEKQETPKPKQESRPSHEQHGTSAQQRQGHPAGKSAHIPDPQFRAHFGHQHTFTLNRVITQTIIVPGQTQFVLVGFTFIFLDPWPTEWLFTDDCFIDFVNGEYFLFDVFHPGIRVALFVVG